MPVSSALYVDVMVLRLVSHVFSASELVSTDLASQHIFLNVMLCLSLKPSSQPFEAFSSSFEANFSALAWIIGPETGMFWSRTYLNHVNVAYLYIYICIHCPTNIGQYFQNCFLQIYRF